MADCTGYGFSDSYTLCASGPVGGGATADLTINIAGVSNFESSQVTINDWDGSEVEVDLFPFRKNIADGGNYEDGYLASGAGCSMSAATLTITPEADTDGGTATLEITLDNCNNDPNLDRPYNFRQVPTAGFDNCGGAGSHIISEMTSFSLSEGVCT